MTDSHERQRRRKIPLACEPCRERKSRCDGGKPICISCQRRGLSLDQCIYTTDNARTASKDLYVTITSQWRWDESCLLTILDILKFCMTESVI